MTPTAGRAAPAVRSGLINAGALASGMLTAVLLPPVLVRSLDKQDYSVWMLCLQTVTLVSLLELGIGVTATRLIGQRVREGGISDEGWAIGRAALRLHGFVLALAAALVLVSTAGLPTLFFDIPDAALGPARLTWLVVGMIAALQIPLQSLVAPMTAMHSAYPVMIAMAAASLLASVLVIVAAWKVGSLPLMAAGWAVGQVGGIAYAAVAAHRYRTRSGGDTRGRAIPVGLVFQETRWQSLILLLAFLVSGLDVAIVGRFAFADVAAFAIAASVVIRLVSIVHALQAPLLAEYARDVGAGDTERIGRVFSRQVRLGTLAIVLGFGALAALAPSLFPVWLGHEVGEPSSVFVVCLALGAAIRLLGIPVASLATAAGQQRITLLAGIAESAVNVGLSLWLVQLVGPLGVAFGTIVGSCVSIATHFCVTVPRVLHLVGARAGMLRAAARSSAPLAAMVLGTAVALAADDPAVVATVGWSAVLGGVLLGVTVTMGHEDRVLGKRVAARLFLGAGRLIR